MLRPLKRLLHVKRILCLPLILIYIFSIQVLPVNATISLWVAKEPMPTPRGQSVVISGDDGLIYVIGGVDSISSTALATVEAYDHVTDSWVRKSPLPNATMGAAGAKSLDGTLYVISGSGPGQKSVQAYNPTMDTWTAKASIPTQVWGADATTGEDGKIYVIGGEEGENLVQIYNPNIDAWSYGSPMPTPRSELGVIKGKDNLIYAIGGYSSTEQTVQSTVEAYNPDTDTWHTREPLPEPRCHFATTLDPLGNIYIIGGSESYNSNTSPFHETVYSYDTSTNTWEIEEQISTARRELGGATVANKIFAIGGSNGSSIYLNLNEAAIIPDIKEPNADAGEDIEVIQSELVIFNGSRSTDDIGIANYTWTFIDVTRQRLTGVKPTYIFETAGIHPIMLNVTDWGGNWDTDNIMVIVRDIEAPVVNVYCDGLRIPYDLPPETYRVEPGTAITFYTSDSSEDIETYEWAFGDGSIGFGPSPSYTYLTKGDYKVLLTVKDSAGNTGYDRIRIRVMDKEESSITCSISPSDIVIGNSISISGSLRISNEIPSLSPSDANVTIQILGQEEFKREVILGVDSTFNDTFTPLAVGSWFVKAHWEGNATVKSSSSSDITLTVSKASSSISCSASTLIVNEEESITVFGTTTPTIPNAKIYVIYIGPEETNLNNTVLSDVDGTYSDSIIPAEKGVWRVSASWKGDVTMNGAVSNEVSFTVISAFRFPLETLISSIVIILVVALTGLYFIKPKNKS